MPDPLTITAAITLAGKCINGVTKAVNSGRELEDAMGHISRWFECVSDVNAAENRAKNPSIFQKVTAAKSVEKQGIFRGKAPSAALTGPWGSYMLTNCLP